MTEVLFLWFGIVALVYAFDLYDRGRDLFVTTGLIGVMSIGVYLWSVLSLPVP